MATISPPRALAGRIATTRTRDSRPLLVVVTLAIVFIVNASPWLAGGFGESHDGRNAAIWGMSSRALREAPIESRLGGELEPGYTYANHPPMIIFETAAAETIAGEHRIVTRAPAWVASLAALVLVCALLLDAGLSATAVAAGVTMTFGSAMFLVYGTMLDTPITSFPITVALVWATQRTLAQKPFPTWTVAVLGAFAALSGWQSVVMAAAAALALAMTTAARGRRDRVLVRQLVALSAGTAAGLVLTFSWIHWVYGSFEPLRANRTYRSAGSSLGTSLRLQWSNLWALMPLALVVAGASALPALRNHRTRAMFVMSFGAIVAYAIAFRGAAEMHDYWNYALLLPASISAAAGVQCLLDRATPERSAHLAPIVSLAAVACLALTIAQPSAAQYRFENALSTVRLAALANDRSPADGPALAYMSSGGSLSRWIDYETGRPGLALTDEAALRALAVARPDLPVLIVLPLLDDRSRALAQRTAIAVDGPYALLTPAAAIDVRERP